MAEFFNMNGYGVYIWPCYALSTVLLGVMIAQRRKKLNALQRRDSERGKQHRNNS